MNYIILPILCVIYFEILGQTILNMLKIQPLKFNAVFGFVLFLSIFYISSFMPVYFHMSFKVLLFIFVVLILISIILILFNFKSLHFTFNKKQLLIFLILIAILILASSYNYIGDIKEYDTLTYTNIVGNNIYQDGLNTVDIENGLPGSFHGYIEQSYYLFASVALYITNGIHNLLGLPFFYYTQFIWLYTIVFYVLFSGILINMVITNNKLTNRVKIVLSILIFGFIGSWYWHLYQPYIGNSYRYLLCSYAIYYFALFTKERQSQFLYITLLILLGSVSCSNSNSIILIIFSFATIVICDLNKKEMLITILFTSLPALEVVLQVCADYFVYALLFDILLILVFSIFGSFIEKILKQQYIKLAIIAITLLGLTCFSLLITHKLFDFNTLINNLKMLDDMRWSLTDYSNYWSIIINVIFISVLIYNTIYFRKEMWMKTLLTILILFYNPLTVGLFNKLDPVWFRGFDIIFNIFMIVKFAETFCNKLVSLNLNKPVKIMCFSLIIAVLCLITYKQFTNSNYTTKNNKPNGYNFLLKMTDDEADMLMFAKDYIFNNNLQKSFVSSQVYQLRSEIPTLTTLYNRGRQDHSGEKSKALLMRMFYPDEEYFGACYNTDDFDYSKIFELIKDTKMDIMILGKNKIYHDKEKDNYYPLYLLLNKSVNPIYENDSFVFYDFR